MLVRKEISERDKQIIELARQGKFLAEIGRKFNLTREAIRQIVMKWDAAGYLGRRAYSDEEIRVIETISQLIGRVLTLTNVTQDRIANRTGICKSTVHQFVAGNPNYFQSLAKKRRKAKKPISLTIAQYVLVAAQEQVVELQDTLDMLREELERINSKYTKQNDTNTNVQTDDVNYDTRTESQMEGVEAAKHPETILQTSEGS